MVDDDPDVLAVSVKSLQRCGFPVDGFSSPIHALAHFEQHAGQYALVLSDIRMPQMSGMEFLNHVKKVRPDIPIMAMTSYTESDNDIVESVPSITKEEILHKPFKVLQICTAVKHTLHLPA